MIKDLAKDHDYYCEECNYYRNGTTEEYSTWQKFFEEYGEADIAMNLIFRWDIMLDDETNKYCMKLFFMQQRKGRFYCCIVEEVTDEDEQSIREFLKKYLEYIKNLWSPISDEQE